MKGPRISVGEEHTTYAWISLRAHSLPHRVLRTYNQTHLNIRRGQLERHVWGHDDFITFTNDIQRRSWKPMRDIDNFSIVAQLFILQLICQLNHDIAQVRLSNGTQQYTYSNTCSLKQIEELSELGYRKRRIEHLPVAAMNFTLGRFRVLPNWTPI